jgi:hypothetical protein
MTIERAMKMLVDGIPVWKEANYSPPGTPVDYESGLVQAGPYVMKWARLAEAGHACDQHAHPHDHATIVAAGSFDAYVEGEYLGMFLEGQAIHVKANKKHLFVARQPGSIFWCIHYLPEEI